MDEEKRNRVAKPGETLNVSMPDGTIRPVKVTEVDRNSFGYEKTPLGPRKEPKTRLQRFWYWIEYNFL